MERGGVKAMKIGTAGPPSVSERMLLLLEVVAGRDEPATLAELTAAMGLSKATVHRFATLLASLGFLERTLDGKRYAVGPRFATLAAGALRNSIAAAPRRTVLRDLVARLGETCNVTVLEGSELVYLDRVESAWPLQVRLRVGSHVPLHCTASGKLFLALLPEKAVKNLLSSGELERHTSRTIVDREAFLRALERIRETRIGTDDGEFIEGMCAAAVPVLDASGRIAATIAVHGPDTRLSLDAAVAHVPALREAAARLSGLLATP